MNTTRFNVGDEVRIVSNERCKFLDRKYCNKYDHSFMGGKLVTIKSTLDENTTSLKVYTINEAEGYYWEEEYFE